MNIGANSVTDYGLYFQWGDTQGYTAEQVGSGSGQKAFKWTDYKLGNGGSGATDMTKYNSTDGKTALDASDDAAQANWGGSWRMPTGEEFQALGTATTSEWTTSYEGSGVAGVVLTSKADSNVKLFFPAPGYCHHGSMSYVGSYGYYWSSSLYASNVAYGRCLYFSSANWTMGNVGNGSRCLGYSVRGVVG